MGIIMKTKLNAAKRLTAATKAGFEDSVKKLEHVLGAKGTLHTSKLRDKSIVHICKIQGSHDLGEATVSYFEANQEIALNLVIYGKYRDTRPYLEYKDDDAGRFHAHLTGQLLIKEAAEGFKKAKFDLEHDENLDEDDKLRIGNAMIALRNLCK